MAQFDHPTNYQPSPFFKPLAHLDRPFRDHYQQRYRIVKSAISLGSEQAYKHSHQEFCHSNNNIITNKDLHIGYPI